MKNENKTKEQLIKELEEMHQHIAELEASEEKRKRTLETLEEINAFIQSVIDCIDEPITMINTNSQIQLMNQAARELFTKGAEPVSLLCYQCLHGRRAPCRGVDFRCPMLKTREAGRPVTVVHEHFLPNGESRLFEIIASPLWSKDGTGNRRSHAGHHRA